MKKLIVLLCIGLGACSTTTIGKLEIPAVDKADPLMSKTVATAGNSNSLTLKPEDAAIFSRIHDIAISRCLVFKNAENTIFTIGSIGVTDGDIALAAIPSALALAGVSSGAIAGAAGVSAIFNVQLKNLIGLPTPSPTYAPTVAGFDYLYNLYAHSPGIASLMNGTDTERNLAISEYRIAIQQICISRLQMPTNSTSVYTPVSTKVTTTTDTGTTTTP